MDVDSLGYGVDFVAGVQRAIETSSVVLVLIGEGWLLTPDDRGGQRIDYPDDNVRLEVEHAFRLRRPVLPVLLDGAPMPRRTDLPASIGDLSHLNAVRVGHDSWGLRCCSAPASRRDPPPLTGRPPTHDRREGRSRADDEDVAECVGWRGSTGAGLSRGPAP